MCKFYSFKINRLLNKIYICSQMAVLKELLTYLLILSLGCNILGSTVCITAYEINKKYIAENLCENKSRPSMHCEGHCHLQKKLKEDEQQKEDTPNSLKNGPELLFLNQPFRFVFIDSYFTFINKTSNSNLFCKPFLPGVFHPPAC